MPERSPFAFSQIAEMNSTPADIPIPELENLRRGLAPAFAPTQQLSGQEETARALEKMRDFQARTVVQGKMSEGAIPPNSMTINSKDGTMDIKGLSVDTYQAIMRDREELNNIRGSFAQEAARLQAQEAQARSQPWAQLATALSANLAQAPNLPGWVQAAGRTAAQLNPTADQLRNQRLAVLGQQAQMSEKAGALDIAELRTMATQQEQAASLKTKQEKEVRETANKITSTLRLVTKPGEALDPKAVEQIIQLNDPNNLLTPEQRQGAIAAAGQMAVTAKAGKEAEQKRKVDLAQVSSDLSKSRNEDKANLDLRNRMAVLQQSFANSVSPTKLEFLKNEATFKAELQKEMLKAKDALHLNGAEFKTLESVNATAAYVGRTMRMLDDPEFRNVAGPLMAYNPDTKKLEFVGEAALPKAWTSEKRAQVSAQLAHEIPRIGELAFPGGISRIASTPMGKELIQSLGANINQRPDQMQAVLKAVLDANMDRSRAVVVAHPGAFGPETPYGSLVGTDNPDLQDYWTRNIDAFGHQMAPPSPFGGGATKPVGRPKNKYFDAATGKWVTP